MMQVPGAHLITLHSPVRYTSAQIDKAAAIAYQLQRGQFILLEKPQR